MIRVVINMPQNMEHVPQKSVAHARKIVVNGKINTAKFFGLMLCSVLL